MNLAQKKVFFRDISYVLEQAAALRDYMNAGHKASLQGHPFERVIDNALVESSLSFLRKANEFFGKTSGASVRVFFPDYPVEWLWDKGTCTLLNDRVMHLSLCEALEGKLDWGQFYGTHLPEAEQRFAVFLDRVRKEQPELMER